MRAGAKSVRLFEVGRVFLPPNGEEIRRLALLLCGAAGVRRTGAGAPARSSISTISKERWLRSVWEFTLRRSASAEFVLATELWQGDQRRGVAGQLSSAQAAKAAAVVPVFWRDRFA